MAKFFPIFSDVDPGNGDEFIFFSFCPWALFDKREPLHDFKMIWEGLDTNGQPIFFSLNSDVADDDCRAGSDNTLPSR